MCNDPAKWGERPTEEYRGRGRYDLWRGVWRVVRSNVPGLAVEAATREAFVAEVERACAERAGGHDHRVSVVTTKKSLWTFKPRFGKWALVNLRLLASERVEEVTARYEAAG